MSKFFHLSYCTPCEDDYQYKILCFNIIHIQNMLKIDNGLFKNLKDCANIEKHEKKEMNPK